MGTLALIGLGSNLGDRRAILEKAVTALASTPGVEIRAVSSYHETAPVGGPPGQGPFLNAAATLECDLDPDRLLEAMREIEASAGRVRAVRWGERTLDLDLLLFGDSIIGRDPRISLFWPVAPKRLQVPHPWLPFRRFVLAPAAEVAADIVDPITRRTISQLLANVDRRPSYVALAGWPASHMRRLFRRITRELNATGFSGGDPRWDEAAHTQYGRLLENLGWPFNPAAGKAGMEYWNREKESGTSELGNALRADRWSEALWGDRWMVTDFWLDQWYRWVRSDALDAETPPERAAIEPTFVALIPPCHVNLADRTRPSQVQLASCLRSPPPLFAHRNPPSIFQADQEAERDEAILRPIIDACKATRSGIM